MGCLGEGANKGKGGIEVVWGGTSVGKQREKGTKRAVRMPVWPFSVPDHCGMSCLLIKLSLAIFLVRVSAWCAGLCMEVRVPVMGRGTPLEGGHRGTQQPVCWDGSSWRHWGAGGYVGVCDC